MWKYLFLLYLIELSSSAFSQTFDFQNIELLGYYNDTTIPSSPNIGNRYSGCFGWTNPNDSRKYAIVGTSRSTQFVEVTNSAMPVLRDEVEGRRINCVWREYKTYGKYAYMISDDDYPNSFQIADMSYLPDSVHIVMDSDSIFSRAHTIFIDGNKMYLGCVKTNPSTPSFSSMNIYSLQNPEKPYLLRKLEEDYILSNNQVHDMFVRHDTIFASCGYDGLNVFIYDSVANKFNVICNLSGYQNAGYNHSSTWSDDGKTLVMSDEVPKKLPAKVVDVSTINEPFITAFFNSSDSATPHNSYFLKNSKICVFANYEDGTQLFDVSDINNPIRIGFFDTHYQSTPATNHGNYAGNWGCYVEFNNGIVLSNDMQNGLFVLNISPAISNISSTKQENFSIWPNPIEKHVYINQETAKQITEWSLTNIYGQKVHSNKHWPEEGINIENQINGLYFLSISTKELTKTFRLLKSY